MKLASKSIVFREMDMGIRWLITFSLWLIHTELAPIHDKQVNWLAPKSIFIISLVCYVLYLLMELARYVGIKSPGFSLSFHLAPLNNPIFVAMATAVIDLGFLTVALLSTPVMAPFLYPIYLYYALMLSLRHHGSKPIAVGMLSAASFFLSHLTLSPQGSGFWLSLVSSSLVFVFSAIVWEISRAFDHFYQRNQHALAEIEHKNSLLEKSAQTDFLTDLYNHQAFYHALDKYIKYHVPVSLILFDIDNFKKINDQYGHVAGDYVLREVASRIKSGLREGDVAARYGGEEFAVILPDTQPLIGWQIADRIRQSIAQQRFEVDGQELTVTLSGGVGTARSTLDKTGQAIFVDQVDTKLYQAKHSGKNCVKLTDPSQDYLCDLTVMDQVLTHLQERLLPSLFTHKAMTSAVPTTADIMKPHPDVSDRITPQDQRLLWQIIDQLHHIATKPQAVHMLLNAAFRDCDTLNSHNVRTAFYAMALGAHMGLMASDNRQVGLAALLHDFGKIHIPSSILNKPAALTHEEFSLIKMHPASGYALLKNEQWLPWHIKKAVLCHHERLDGTGYPAQLRGKALSRNDRLLAICDIFDAMTSQRPYKKACTPEKALKLMADEEVGRIDLRLFKHFKDLISSPEHKKESQYAFVYDEAR